MSCVCVGPGRIFKIRYPHLYLAVMHGTASLVLPHEDIPVQTHEWHMLVHSTYTLLCFVCAGVCVCAHMHECMHMHIRTCTYEYANVSACVKWLEHRPDDNEVPDSMLGNSYIFSVTS